MARYTNLDGQNTEIMPGAIGLDTSTELVTVQKDGVKVARRRKINFKTGTGVTVTIKDNPANDSIDITITSP